jgi:hypothetical protein
MHCRYYSRTSLILIEGNGFSFFILPCTHDEQIKPAQQKSILALPKRCSQHGYDYPLHKPAQASQKLIKLIILIVPLNIQNKSAINTY